MLKILIADDHAVVRGGVRNFLEAAKNVECVGEATTGAEAIALVRKADWNVLLLDISLPDLDGLEVLKRIKRERPNLPVLIFSMHAEDEYAARAFEAGAAGYLPKESSPAQILQAIMLVASGAYYTSPALTSRLLAGTLSNSKRLPHESLSQREMEIMLGVSEGTPLTKIGEQLFLSVKTVSTYRSRVLEKLSVSSNAEITRYVLEHKLG